MFRFLLGVNTLPWGQPSERMPNGDTERTIRNIETLRKLKMKVIYSECACIQQKDMCLSKPLNDIRHRK